MSLAEELLADLEDIGNEEDDDDLSDDNDDAGAMYAGAGGEARDAEMADASAAGGDIDASLLKATDVRGVARLFYGARFASIQAQIAEHMKNDDAAGGQRREIVGPVEHDPEYKLIVSANNLTVEIDNEIAAVHKFIRDIYVKRFPELESLVLNSMDYIRTVKMVGNDMEVTKKDLASILPSAIVMVVTVTSSTTQGDPLLDEELTRVMEACDVAIALDEGKRRILHYVESRMSLVAPNLSAIVGPTTAANLMGIAGGLSALSKMPACNVQVLGSGRKNLAGFSTATSNVHAGCIFHSPFVQNLPSDFRTKAARLCAAKCTLAARIDSFHQAVDGSEGMKLRDDIMKKMDKAQEAPPAKVVKPLPAPDEAPRKKRGGKRARRMKERFAVTEVRRQANRMQFGTEGEDNYQREGGQSIGMVGKDGSGKVRAAKVDPRVKVGMSKKLQKELQKTITAKSATSGLASSVCFTAVQGIEIINPHAAEKRAPEGNRYFSDGAGFLSGRK